MLEVPPFTPAEGSALLAAAGGGWLPEDQREDLVRAVDGHALATGVLAGLLAARPPASDLAALRAELAAATRTDARVGKVLEFYADRMAEPDRYLLAAVSLFARPVDPGAVLAVAAHEAFGSRLAGWTPAMVQAAVRGRLAGLASWHPDGTISAHPLVRDTFRPLVLAAAGTAADTALAGMPTGTVQDRADALRVVEVIELLLDAGQWQAADDMYRNRSGILPVWHDLARGPARAAGRRRVRGHPRPPRRLRHPPQPPRSQLLHERYVGLFAMNAGDLATAREYLSLAVRYDRDAGDMETWGSACGTWPFALAISGRSAWPGPPRPKRSPCAETTGDQAQIPSSRRSWGGWLAWPATWPRPSSSSPPPIRSRSPHHGRDHLYSLAGTCGRSGWPAPGGPARPGR